MNIENIDYIPGTTIAKPSVKLVGNNGNAYAILGSVKLGLREAGCDDRTIEQFIEEATSNDYDHLLSTCFRWVKVV